MSALLDKLQALDPASLWSLAPKPLLMQGSGLLATGEISALHWTGDDQLDFEFPNRLGFLVHRLKLENGSVVGHCDAHPMQPCAHHLAALMLSMQLLKDFGAFGRFPNRSIAEQFKLQLLRTDRRAISQSAPEKPQEVIKRHILIRPASTNLFSYRDRFSHALADAYAAVPQEVKAFTTQWTIGDREEAFWRWFTNPVRQFPVFIELGQDIQPVERPHHSGWTIDQSIALNGERITVSRRLLHHGQPVEEQVVGIGETMLYLPTSQQLLRVGRSGADLWHQLRRDLTSQFGRSVAFSRATIQQAETSENDIHLTLREWNALDCPWASAESKSSPMALEWNGQPIEAPAVVRPKATIALAPSDDAGTIDVRLRLCADDINLDADLAALTIEETLGAMCADPQLLASKARREAITATVFEALITSDPAQREALLDDIQQHEAFRAQHQAKLAAQLVRNFLHHDDAVRFPRLYASATKGWIVVPEIIDISDIAAALIRHVLGARSPHELGFYDREDDVLCVSVADALPRLPRLVAECSQRGIDLTFADKPISLARLDCLVSATKKREDIDFFELKPEVTCNGTLIPQDQWESLVIKGHMFDEDGSLRIIDLQSLRSLERVTQMLKRQTREQEKKEEKLRIPRIRILDWLLLQRHGVKCDLPDEDRRILESLMRFEQLDRSPLPAVRATLRDYQHAGYSWLAFLYQHGFGACLADDMGLGKTLQTITLLAAIKEGIVKPLAADASDRRPHLLVLPPTLLFNWQHEVKTFYPSLYVHEYTGKGRSLIGITEGIVLTTYELVRRDIDKLRERKFDCIIFDEAQAVKNQLGERAKAMRQLQGRFKLTLTGTPLENHAGEYYSIIDLALPGLFGDYREFTDALKATTKDGFNPLDRARPFVLRRTKEKILKELPPKVESDLQLDLTEEQKRFYTRAVADVRAEVLAAFKDKTAQQAGIVALAALTRLRQICVSPALIDTTHTEISPKIQYLVEKLRELTDEGHSALVFSQFTKSLDLLQQHLEQAPLPYLRLDGSTPQQKRKVLVESFQSGKGPGLFLISLKAGGAGLNLTRASYVFHLDPWWNPAVENQASDRAHRMGQTQTVFIQRLLMRHTIEEKIMQLKAQKRELFDRVLAGTETDERTQGTIITKEDFSFLLA